MCPLGRPLCVVSGHAAWPWLRWPGRRGARYSAYSEAPAAMSPRQRHCSPPDPARSGSPLACSTCSLWLCCSRCKMMQSRAHSPRELQARPSRGRGGGWSQRRGRREGSDGNILRRVPPGARRATADCTTGGCAGRRPRRRTRQDVHRQGASAPPRPPGWDPCRAGVPPRAFCLGGRQSSPPPTAVWASLTQDPELCKLSGLLASPQRKANSN